MTSVGIDFGTSNCSAFVPLSESIDNVPLEGKRSLLPSMIFAKRGGIALKEVDNNELNRRVRQAINAEQRRGKNITEEYRRVVQRDVEKAMQREAASDAEEKYWEQTFFSLPRSGDSLLFGTAALQAYNDNPLDGVLLKSPKSFIGSKIAPQYLGVFQDIVKKMLSHILIQVKQHTKRSVSNAVIGRPVCYQGMGGEDGNNQALRLMENAAKAVGIENVVFYFEPIAAALDYEKTIRNEQLVLVVDIGGGTTDCAMIRLSPSSEKKVDRSSDVLGYSGARIGGTDFDQELAWRCFMPLLGKDKIPNGVLFDAVSTRDLPARLRFQKAGYKIERLIEDHPRVTELERVRTLHESQLQHQLINSAELTKLQLSELIKCTVPLEYLEKDLVSGVTRDQFKALSESHLRKIQKIMRDAEKSAGVLPDAVFLTGGMGFSPVVQDAVRQVFGSDIPIQLGDMLGSVGKGLGECARLAFGPIR